MYDPTDEFDQIEESSGPALGEGRRQTLDALDQKDRLPMIDPPDGDSDSAGFDSFEDLADAIREISLARPDGTMYRAPPEEIVEAAESIYQALPDDARPEYLADETLRRRINTARRRFNDWMDALQRSQEMPSPMEAGPANYPADKARDRSQRTREASEDLDDALDNVKSAVRGARQRALEAIGSSVAEQNAKENRSLAERRKNRTEKGYTVLHFDGTSRGVWLPWGVKRVNQKSLRLRRPHARAGEEKDSPLSNDGETYPEYREVTVDLDSDFLIVPPAGDVSTDVLLEAVEDKADGNTGDWEHYDTWAGYQEHLLGEDFVEGLDSYDPGEEIDRAGGNSDQEAATDGDTYDPTDEWTDDRPQQDTLVETTAEGQAARDRETRIETGASDEFADDRHQEESTDAGTQSSLLAEDIEGQASLTGEQAETGPEYKETRYEGDVNAGEVDGPLDSQQRGQIQHYASEDPDLLSLLRSINPYSGVDLKEYHRVGIETPEDLVDYYDEHGGFESINGVGPATNEELLAAVAIVRAELAGKEIPEPGEYDPDLKYRTGRQVLDNPEQLSQDGVDESDEYPGYIGEWDRVRQDPPGYEDTTGSIEVFGHRPGSAVKINQKDTTGWYETDSTDLKAWLMQNDPEDAAAMLGIELGDCGCDMDDWTGAVDYLRQHYSDDYQARIELASDLREFASEQGMDAPQSLGDEGVLQPLVRYQNVNPADAKAQIKDRAPSHHHDALFDVITAFAASEAARHDESPDSRSTYDPCCEYDNPEEWGPTANRPISDVAGALKSPEERRIKQAERERAEYEESAGGRMKVDEPIQKPADLDPGLVEALERQTYDPTDDMDPDGTTGEVVQDLSKPPGVDAANAVVDAVSEDEPGEQGETGDEAHATWTRLGDEFYGWELTDEGGANTYSFKHRLGQRVVAERGREEGWHVDLHNPDWPDHTKWLTDPDARDRQPGRGTGDRRREPVDLKTAYSAAYDEMARIFRQAEYDDDQYESTTSNESNDAETEQDSGDTDNTENERPERIEFGSKNAADEFREQYPEHIHESDDRRKKTVTFEPDTPENVLDQAGTKSTISQGQSKKYGQAELTDAELDRLQDRPDWSWNPHGFHAQAAKALLQEEGGTPWLDYYDHTIEVDEHLSVIESGVDMAVEEGLSGPGEGRDDTAKSEAEIARDLDEGYSRMCRRAEDACSEGEEEACEALLEDCGYSEDEIAELMEATRELGESPLDVYDPTTEAGETTSFEDWAREQAPARPDPEEIDGPVPERPDPPTPDEPDDEELRQLAPARLDEMSGATLGALRKAWAGYKMARAEDREAHKRMDEYAEIINGIRVVNDQEPIDFDQREGWDGGPVLPDDPNEEYPVGDGSRQKSLSEAIRDGAAGVIEGAQATLGDTYDPTKEF